jgi:hypothetical protein
MGGADAFHSSSLTADKYLIQRVQREKFCINIEVPFFALVQLKILLWVG